MNHISCDLLIQYICETHGQELTFNQVYSIINNYIINYNICLFVAVLQNLALQAMITKRKISLKFEAMNNAFKNSTIHHLRHSENW